MSYLILVRHGQSRWNIGNKFTGWVDVPLSEKGVQEAVACAGKLQNVELDIAFTSRLERAQATLLIILAQQHFTGYFLHYGNPSTDSKYLPAEIQKEDIPIVTNRDLNERYYGDLQGMDKNEARKVYGEDTVFAWRRGFKDRPPGGESLEDTYNRVVPYFEEHIMKEVDKGKNVIVAAHGNSLRAMIKHLDDISEDQIPYLNLPTGEPIIYKYENGELNKVSEDYSFNRPTEWGNEKY